MRIATSSLLIGAAAVAALPGRVIQHPGEQIIELPSGELVIQGLSGQQILSPSGNRVSQSAGEQIVERPSQDRPCHEHDAHPVVHGSAKWLQESLDSLSSEERSVWDEVSMMFPEEMKSATKPTLPKKHHRRPESYWDHYIRGADIERVWVENVKGEQEREVDGELGDYNLRTKKVDPSELGVDPGVKQYSGYLDDEAEDKHLFYCNSQTFLVLYSLLIQIRVL